MMDPPSGMDLDQDGKDAIMALEMLSAAATERHAQSHPPTQSNSAPQPPAWSQPQPLPHATSGLGLGLGIVDNPKQSGMKRKLSDQGRSGMGERGDWTNGANEGAKRRASVPPTGDFLPPSSPPAQQGAYYHYPTPNGDGPSQMSNLRSIGSPMTRSYSGPSPPSTHGLPRPAYLQSPYSGYPPGVHPHLGHYNYLPGPGAWSTPSTSFPPTPNNEPPRPQFLQGPTSSYLSPPAATSPHDQAHPSSHPGYLRPQSFPPSKPWPSSSADGKEAYYSGQGVASKLQAGVRDIADPPPHSAPPQLPLSLPSPVPRKPDPQTTFDSEESDRPTPSQPPSRSKTSSSLSSNRTSSMNNNRPAPPKPLAEDAGIIRCICSYDDDDGFTIQCERCFAWQHAICVGVEQDNVPDKYMCELCDPSLGAGGNGRKGKKRVMLSVKDANERQRLRKVAEQAVGSIVDDPTAVNAASAAGMEASLSNVGKRARGRSTTNGNGTTNGTEGMDEQNGNGNGNGTEGQGAGAKGKRRSLPHELDQSVESPNSNGTTTTASRDGAPTTAKRRRSAKQVKVAPVMGQTPSLRSASGASSALELDHAGRPVPVTNPALNLGISLSDDEMDEKYEPWQWEYTPTSTNIYVDEKALTDVKTILEIVELASQEGDGVDGRSGQRDVGVRKGKGRGAGASPALANALITFFGDSEAVSPLAPPKDSLLSSLCSPVVPLEMDTLPSVCSVSVKPLATASFSLAPPATTLFSNTTSTTTISCPYPRPTIHALFAGSSIPSGSFIAEFKGEIISRSRYCSDPFNQYSSLGTPKNAVRALPFPWSVMIDARRYGNECRFIRNGCHPNAVIKPVMVRKRRTTGDQLGNTGGDLDLPDAAPQENGIPELAFGVFATSDIAKREEIVLPWDWDDDHIIHTLPILLGTSPVPAHTRASLVQSPDLPLLSKRMAAVSLILLGLSCCACEKRKDCAVAWMWKVASASAAQPRGNMSKEDAFESAMQTILISAGRDDLGAVNGGPKKSGRKVKRPELGPLVGLERRWKLKERRNGETVQHNGKGIADTDSLLRSAGDSMALTPREDGPIPYLSATSEPQPLSSSEAGLESATVSGADRTGFLAEDDVEIAEHAELADPTPGADPIPRGDALPAQQDKMTIGTPDNESDSYLSDPLSRQSDEEDEDMVRGPRRKNGNALRADRDDQQLQDEHRVPTLSRLSRGTRAREIDTDLAPLQDPEHAFPIVEMVETAMGDPSNQDGPDMTELKVSQAEASSPSEPQPTRRLSFKAFSKRMRASGGPLSPTMDRKSVVPLPAVDESLSIPEPDPMDLPEIPLTGTTSTLPTQVPPDPPEVAPKSTKVREAFLIPETEYSHPIPDMPTSEALRTAAALGQTSELECDLSTIFEAPVAMAVDASEPFASANGPSSLDPDQVQDASTGHIGTEEKVQGSAEQDAEAKQQVDARGVSVPIEEALKAPTPPPPPKPKARLSLAAFRRRMSQQKPNSNPEPESEDSRPEVEEKPPNVSEEGGSVLSREEKKDRPVQDDSSEFESPRRSGQISGESTTMSPRPTTLSPALDLKPPSVKSENVVPSLSGLPTSRLEAQDPIEALNAGYFPEIDTDFATSSIIDIPMSPQSPPSTPDPPPRERSMSLAPTGPRAMTDESSVSLSPQNAMKTLPRKDDRNQPTRSATVHVRASSNALSDGPSSRSVPPTPPPAGLRSFSQRAGDAPLREPPKAPRAFASPPPGVASAGRGSRGAAPRAFGSSTSNGLGRTSTAASNPTSPAPSSTARPNDVPSVPARGGPPPSAPREPPRGPRALQSSGFSTPSSSFRSSWPPARSEANELPLPTGPAASRSRDPPTAPRISNAPAGTADRTRYDGIPRAPAAMAEGSLRGRGSPWRGRGRGRP